MCFIMECIQQVNGDEVQTRFADATRTREHRGIHSMKKKRRRKKSVSFSQTSEVQEYYSHDKLYDKSYSIVERKRFKRGMLMEAIRIRRRILLLRNESSSTSSMKIKDVIAPEELIGIEQLVQCQSVSHIGKLRSDHVQAVLTEQKRMMMEMNDFRETANLLREFAVSRSIKSVLSARTRAITAIT